MLSKSTNNNKRHIVDYEYEPPDKKLITDGDLLIKQLSQKQLNTKMCIKDLDCNKTFYKVTELVPATEYTAGSNTLQEFVTVSEHCDNVEQLKSYGLTNQDIQLFLDNKAGPGVLKSKHKNLNERVLNERLNTINDIIKSAGSAEISHNVSVPARQQSKTMLSAKPHSLETKLLKFAIENHELNESETVQPCLPNLVNLAEKQLLYDVTVPNIKQIRKEARSLGKQIKRLSGTSMVINEPTIPATSYSLAKCSKWDVKQVPEPAVKITRMYTCMPRTIYTVKDGEISEISSHMANSTLSNEPQHSDNNLEQTRIKLSIDELKQDARFQNYTPGTPSNVLYMKNLHGVTQTMLEDLLAGCSKSKDIVSVRLLAGKMRGQAFVHFTSTDAAQTALAEMNGLILLNKPVVIQFGKKSESVFHF